AVVTSRQGVIGDPEEPAARRRSAPVRDLERAGWDEAGIFDTHGAGIAALSVETPNEVRLAGEAQGGRPRTAGGGHRRRANHRRLQKVAPARTVSRKCRCRDGWAVADWVALLWLRRVPAVEGVAVVGHSFPPFVGVFTHRILPPI